MGIVLQRLFQYHEDPAFVEHQQARCRSPSFPTTKVHYSLNSFGTEEPLPPKCETLQKLPKSINNKRQELLTESVVLHHDIACSQVSSFTHAKRSKLKWEQLDHLPYSPEISTCDFRVFGLLKKHLKGQCFNSDDEFKDAVKD